MSEKVYKVDPKWRRVNLSIATKTLIAFLLIIFVLAGGFYYFTNIKFSAQIEEDAMNSLHSRLTGAWRLYNIRMEQMKLGMLQAGSEDYIAGAVERKDSGFLRKLLTGYASSRPYVDLWAVVDEHNRVIGRRNRYTGNVLEINGIVKKAIETAEPVMSTEVVSRDFLVREDDGLASRVEGSGLMQFAVVPVQSGGSVRGAFVTGILLNNNHWLPNSIYEGYNVNGAVLAKGVHELRVITSTMIPRAVFSPLAIMPDDISATLTENRHFLGRAFLEENDIYTAAEPILNHEGKAIGALAVGVHTSEVSRTVVSVRNSILIVTVIGVAFSLILAVFTYRGTRRPINALAGAMDEMAEGNLGVRVDIKTGDDFEHIARGFNHMAESIKVREKRLDRFNELSKILIQSMEPEELLRKALARTIELTNSHMGVVYLHDEDTGSLKPFVSFGISDGELRPLNAGEGLAGKCAYELKTVVLQDLKDANISLETGFSRILPAGLAWFPMVCKERLIGVFAIGSLQPYGDDEITHIEYLVTQIAIALDNAIVHQEVEKLSITDPLTGLYNRRHFQEHMNAEFARSKRYRHPLAVVMIDIDDFKRINDTHGHQQGDRILSDLSRLLKSKTRTTDVWARYGGEEFIGLISHCPPDGIFTLSEKLRKAVEESTFAGMNGSGVTVSIGVGVYPSEGITGIDELILAADQNLYKAKRSGKNMVVMGEYLRAVG